MRPIHLKRSAIRPILTNVLDSISAYLNTDDGSVIYVTPSARTTHRILVPSQITVEHAAGVLEDADHLEDWQRWDALNAAKVVAEDTPYRKIPLDAIDRAYDDMWAFIQTVGDPKLRDRLKIDVQQDWPFKRLEKTLARNDIERDRWFKFLEKQRFKRFVLWLSEQGFYPEWDDNMKHRCDWVNSNDPLYIRYHDEEWGVPVHTEAGLFERLCLEAAEAGLSWILILRKRENYRLAFDGFDPAKVARYDEAKIEALLQNDGIIRSRAKIEAAVHNAARFLEVQAEFGSFDAYLWAYVGGKPIQNKWETIAQVPSETPLSQKMSKDLKKRGFKFVGPTICYSTMQAAGLVNDHIVECFRHAELKRL